MGLAPFFLTGRALFCKQKSLPQLFSAGTGMKSISFLRCHPAWRFPARSTPYHHTASFDNGGNSVSPTDALFSACSVRPRKSIHLRPCAPVPPFRDSLGHGPEDYFSFSSVWLYHSRAIKNCQSLFLPFSLKYSQKTMRPNRSVLPGNHGSRAIRQTQKQAAASSAPPVGTVILSVPDDYTA